MSTQTFENLGRRAVAELREMVAKFGAGEAEVAQTYFAKTRTREQDITWMTSQAGRELSRVYQLWAEARQDLEGLGRGGDRYRLRETLQKAIEELNHFIAVAEVLESITGQPADVAELRRYDFFEPDPTAPANKENAKLAEVNRRIDQRIRELETPSWAPLVQDQGLLEGGGNGIFYALSQLKGGDLEQRLAQVMQMILDDEVDHGPSHLAEVEHLVQTENDLRQARELTRLRGEQRLRWRNEQFGYPLSEARIQEILDGKIEPLPLFYQEAAARFP